MTAALLAMIGLPAASGVLLLLAGRRIGRASAAVSLTAAAITLAAAVVAAVTAPAVVIPFISSGGAALAVDGLSAVLLPTVAAVALLVLVFSAAEGLRPEGRFHGLMLLFMAAVLLTVTATSLPALLAAWEVMGATSYALIGFRWQQARTIPAGLTAFAVTRAADLGIYAAAGAAVASGTGWRLDELAAADGPWLHVIAAGMLIAGLGKAAQLPFSFWLSRAMEGPGPVSALLHSAAMVAMGGYLLLRLEPVLLASGWAGPVAAWIGAGTAVVLGIIALGQSDLKQLLAASTAAQLGFVVLAAGLGATAGGAAQLIAHAATKALLFLIAGAWLTAAGSKQFAALRGIGRRWTLAGTAFLVGALSLAGLPPLSLWLAKDAILATALHTNAALYAAGLMGAALAAAYSAKMIAVVWAKPSTREQAEIEQRLWDTEQRGTRRIPAATSVPLIVLALAAAVLGVLAIPGFSAPFRRLLHAQAEAESTVGELVASAGIALVVAVLVLRRGTPHIAAAKDWFGLEQIAARVLVRPMFGVADALARLDGRLDSALTGSARLLDRTAATSLAHLDGRLDAAITGSARLLDRTAATTHVLDHGVGRMLKSLSRGTAALGRLARRVQTGAVADYYAGAAVVTVCAFILLIVVR
ncbi:proton-conducting transporter membrane subunit [Paeniglutamicibacter gangotriensis]|uniref:NADH-quinone oxidoreductase subunit L n=1 Tax=Paeniglutamicibacter gangotriensis TaxID=254787 RepID=A0A5B0E7M5_9MICC|nr:proton-conducting transporter membrane subunit [Paeniglutamicibacter gangotriensis]KAA0973419.1 NADH-quinone oxidoreductase subunit L [Paeniglutamicibacter gangotriensis]